MKSRTMLLTLVLFVLSVSVCSVFAGEPGSNIPGQKAGQNQSIYACSHCHVMALKDGKCPGCGMEMESRNLLGTKGDNAEVCGCGAGCKQCDAKTVKDGKCACGKEVKELSAKGNYVCPDGCAEVSDHPGKCACGKEMRKVE